MSAFTAADLKYISDACFDDGARVYEHELTPFECGQGHGYRPADESDLKAERETAFENGFLAGMGVCALLAALLIAAFYIAARVGTP